MCYSKSILKTVKKFYGYHNIDDSNYKDISTAIKENYREGIFEKIIREACNIKYILNQCCRTDIDSSKNDSLLQPIMHL